MGKIDWNNREEVNTYNRKWKEKNREKVRKYGRQYYAKNKDKQAAHRISQKKRAIEYLGGECSNVFCAQLPTEPHHFDIHHTKGKNYNFAQIWDYKWENIQKEIDDCECVLLCKICHSDITYGKSEKPLNTPEELE